MKAIDQFDVREAFEALDTECRGDISFEDLQTIYLGLDFQPCLRKTANDFRQEARQKHGWSSSSDRLPLSMVLQILSEYTRDRAKNLEDTFQLIDQERKGYINQKDIQNLAKDVGEEYASEEKTKALITSFCTNSTSNHHGRVMNRHEFYRLFSPPEP